MPLTICFSFIFLCYLFIIIIGGILPILGYIVDYQIVKNCVKVFINKLHTQIHLFTCNLSCNLNRLQMEFETEDQFSAWFHSQVRNNWTQTRYCCFHVPNELARLPGETKEQHMRRVMKAKAMGVVPGVADHLLIWMGRIWAFELKLPNGRTSDEQAALHSAWNAQGITVFIFHDTNGLLSVVDQIIRGIVSHFEAATYIYKQNKITRK